MTLKSVFLMMLTSSLAMLQKVQEQTLRKNRANRTKVHGSGCRPRLYVYELPSDYTLESKGSSFYPGIPLKSESLRGFPPSIQLRSIDQYALPIVFNRRALKYTCRTSNPNHADLFYVPVYDMDYGRHDCGGSITERQDNLFRVLAAVRNHANESFLEARGGADHVLATSYQAAPQDGIPWRTKKCELKMDDPRLGHSALLMFGLSCHTWAPQAVPHEPYWSITRSTLWSVPFNSMVMLDAPGAGVNTVSSFPWDKGTHPRPILVSAIFNPVHSKVAAFEDTKGTRSVMGRNRISLLKSCTKHSRKCTWLNPKEMNALDKTNKGPDQTQKTALKLVASVEQRVARTYWDSVFSLHPVGDRYARKGMVDALLLGNIPVLFHERAAREWPWHWEGWWRNATILFDLEEVSSGKVDVVDALSRIDASRIEEMQSVIAANAHRMQWSNEDLAHSTEPHAVHSTYPRTDAFQLTLDGLWRRSRALMDHDRPSDLTYSLRSPGRTVHPTCFESNKTWH